MKGISGHFNECPHRHNTNVRTNYRAPPYLGRRFAFSSPLKQPYYIRIMRIYTLREDAQNTKICAQFVFPRCLRGNKVGFAGIYTHRSIHSGTE